MDQIFKALNDPTRRLVLDRLCQNDGQSLQELEDGMEMTRFGVMKHLKVLEEAALIVTRKKGRFKYHYLNALPLQEVIDRWIEPLLAKPVARHVLSLKAKLEGTAHMPEKPDFIMESFIRCTQDALWHALTDTNELAAFHFMSSVVEGSTEEGGTHSYVMPDGASMLDMTLTKVSAKERIEFVFQPNFFGPGAPASRGVYIIEPQGPLCKLTIEHYEIPDGQESVSEGWARLVSSLKSYLETGEALKVAM